MATFLPWVEKESAARVIRHVHAPGLLSCMALGVDPQLILSGTRQLTAGTEVQEGEEVQGAQREGGKEDDVRGADDEGQGSHPEDGEDDQGIAQGHCDQVHRTQADCGELWQESP